jgi:hypothetical protein
MDVIRTERTVRASGAGSDASNSAVLGSQLIGSIRSSNSREGLNFHLRIPVQMRKITPMEPAMATRTTIVLRATSILEFAAAAEGMSDGVGVADEV